jgi:probable rRNA maturation factor
VGDPPSPTATAVGTADDIRVVGSDEQGEVAVDVARWVALARQVLAAEGACGELTLTFVDGDEIGALNAERVGHEGPTDVLSFPLDDDPGSVPPGVPVLLGDVVIHPAAAVAQAPSHAGTIDDELALLVVHGVLHVLGHDHAEPGDAAAMRARELALLEAHHWHAPAPAGFRQEQP